MQRGDTVAGKYRLNHPLGSGGMAEVWAATNTFTERQVAIKFMSATVARTPESAARFLKEAKVSARVNHPNIIDILDVGQTEDRQLFLVMELLNGVPLETAMRRQTPPMTVNEFTAIMIEVGEALAAAHRAGIVHRDLKPTNIFLHQTKDGVAAKLLDFGVSKFLEDDVNHALTVAGTVLGSPLYMSPEQARGETNLDGRTDVFAFGAIFFEALCGYRPYEAKNFNGLIVKIATTKPKSIDACAPHVPESLRRVIAACMETDLTVRAQSFDVVLPMLRQVIAELEGSAVRLATPVGPASASGDAWTPAGSAHGQTPNTSYASVISVPPPKARHAHGWLLGAGAALLAGGIVVGGVALAHRRSAARPVVEATAAVAPVEAPVRASAATPAAASSELPTVSVDALPGAKTTASSPIPKGYGRLSVSAAPGGCIVSVDGKERGPTPIVLDLAAGPHQVTCKADGAKARATSVIVADGAAAKSRFALDD